MQPVTWGRRVVALLVDWLGCYVVVSAFLRPEDSWAVLVVFALEQLLTVGTIGASPGHALCGLAVRRADDRPDAGADGRGGAGARGAGLPGPVRALGRTALLVLVIPPLVFDARGTGLHDRLVGTHLVRTVRRGASR